MRCVLVLVVILSFVHLLSTTDGYPGPFPYGSLPMSVGYFDSREIFTVPGWKHPVATCVTTGHHKNERVGENLYEFSGYLRTFLG